MLINTFLDTEDFVHLYYPEDEPPATQGCGAGARMASKYPPRPPSPEYSQSASASSSEMSDRERYRAPPQPEPPPHRVRASDLYPRLRPHYDEPGLDVPFSPICGEFVQWVGRMADGGIIAMSNYRLHAQPRRRNGPGSSIPIRLIDALEIRDLLHLIVLCKNGRQLKCTFNTGDQCVEWWRRLNTAMAPMGSVQETFAAAYAAWAKEQPPSSVHRALLKASHSAHRHWFGPELDRLGFTTKGAWRVTAANADYKLCPSYPPLLVVPASICDEDLDSVARFRAMRRIPAVVWRHRGNGAVIARSSQPEVGWLGWRSSEDERLLAAFVSACAHDRGVNAHNNNKQQKLLIVDARSYTSAVTNRARGGGCECQQYYPHADIQFMSMPNIHHVRRSFQQMRALAAEPSDQANWHSNLERTLWLQYVAGIARAAGVVCRAAAAGRPVLVHCSDGWDRTPQIVAAAQLVLDPYYRTIEGFRVLIEREWLDFGHKFADRCGHQFGPEEPNERSPIFLQWLDWVHQMMLQYPCSFEFNEAYLIKLATHVHSCMFGTFLCNSGRERVEARVGDVTAQVWHLLRAPAYTNHLYDPHHHEQVLWPDYSVRSTQVWASMFGGARGETQDEHDDPRPNHDLTKPQQANGIMTKTRSCDNLLNECEKRTTQRRCSDPSIAPDVMKLSMVVNECSARRSCRAALTDSCVDELPATAAAAAATLHAPHDDQDQVDGLHPDHFENSPRTRDLASGSSSLERELCPPTAMADATDTTDATETTPPSVLSVSDVNGAETPEEPAVFVCEPYTDVLGMAEVSVKYTHLDEAQAAREAGRTRNISITWRSISESSNQSSTGFDLAETPHRDNSVTNSMGNSIGNSSRGNSVGNSSRGNSVGNSSRGNSHESSPLDDVNHNVVEASHTNGVNGINSVEEIGAKFLDVELNGAGTSSSVSSESECESTGGTRRRGAGGAGPGGAGRPRGSQLTLCPASPRRTCCHCTTHTDTVCRSGDWYSGSARCVCGGGTASRPDPVDGLPPAPDPLQARLHQIILYQRKVVEELSGQLREAREALRLSSPAPPAPSTAMATAASPAQAASPTAHSHHPQKGQIVGGMGGSSSGSASEVEVGEEARGVVWVPDAAAPRCQHCHHHFWLARRRHHCRRCGGIFCGSCSDVSSWEGVRVCRRCRAMR